MSRAAFCGLLLLTFPAAARAQQGPPPARLAAVQPDRPTRDLRIATSEWRESDTSVPNGLIGAVNLTDQMQVGVGRFSVPEIARPVFHTEAQPRPADVRRRQQGIAAVGISFSF